MDAQKDSPNSLKKVFLWFSGGFLSKFNRMPQEFLRDPKDVVKIRTDVTDSSGSRHS